MELQPVLRRATGGVYSRSDGSGGGLNPPESMTVNAKHPNVDPHQRQHPTYSELIPLKGQPLYDVNLLY